MLEQNILFSGIPDESDVEGSIRWLAEEEEKKRIYNQEREKQIFLSSFDVQGSSSSKDMQLTEDEWISAQSKFITVAIWRAFLADPNAQSSDVFERLANQFDFESDLDSELSPPTKKSKFDETKSNDNKN